MRHVTFDDKSSRRRIFVGDVHGCADELKQLLEEVGYDRSLGDTLVSVGDLVRKGPKTREVVEFARREHMLAVRGNHEERLLKQRKKWRKGTFEPQGNLDTELMTSLSDEDFEWLENLPYTIDFPEDNVLVVHAGLVGGRSREEHTPFEMTEMRSLKNGLVSKICEADEDHWARQWKGPRHVVFGHDAAQGLQLEPFATGLDTGAVYGKHLTCLVVENNKERKLHKIKSFAQYCVPEGPAFDKKNDDRHHILLAIDHVQLAMPAGKEAEGIRFYSGLLGMTVVPKPASTTSRGGCWFESGDVKVHLGVEDDFRPARKAHPAFRVRDVRALGKTIADAGFKVAEDVPMEGIDRLVVYDPFGNKVELIQQLTKSK